MFLWVLSSTSAGCSSCTQFPEVGISPTAHWLRAIASAKPASCRLSATASAKKRRIYRRLACCKQVPRHQCGKQGPVLLLQQTCTPVQYESAAGGFSTGQLT
eukprot:560224-Pleurochrysis_carterae.AAC.1